MKFSGIWLLHNDPHLCTSRPWHWVAVFPIVQNILEKFINILLLTSIIILKEWLSICAQQKTATEKQMKDNINKATQTFQRKVSVEDVNE